MPTRATRTPTPSPACSATTSSGWKRSPALADAPGGFTLWVLGVLAALVSALTFATAVPFVAGALTIAVADS